MSKTVVSISEITYYKKEDIRILSACLSNWFTDPKILHFASPNMTYPFNIKKWISLSYKEKNIKTIIIKVDNWIVGHLSIKYEEDKSLAHLFHLIIDKNQLIFGPSLSMNFSLLNLKTNQNNFHFYPELLTGYKISYGKKIGIIHKASIGVLFEGFQNYKSEIYWVNTLSYHINIGIYYAIN